MSKLSATSKIKLLMPVAYLLASLMLFVLTLMYTDIQTHHIIGIVVTLVAFALWITARVQLGNSFTIAPEAKHLVTTGFYSKLRHPVYYFSILALAGLSIFIWSPYVLLVLVALITLEMVRIREEEKVLTRAFGKEYEEYKKQTWF